MLDVSAQRGKWVGGVETKRRLNVGVLLWALLGGWAAMRTGFFNGRRLAVGNATQWIRCSVDRLTQGLCCTGLTVPFHTSPARCCGNKVVTRRV